MIPSLSHTLNLTIQDKVNVNNYTIRIPEAGQILEIENLKAALTLYYRELSDKGTILSNLALDIVDMTAYFTILCPQLIKDLHAPISKMALPDLLQLRKSFLDQFIPWWNEWLSLINYTPTITSKSTEELKEENEETLQEDPNKKDVHINLG